MGSSAAQDMVTDGMATYAGWTPFSRPVLNTLPSGQRVPEVQGEPSAASLVVAGWCWVAQLHSWLCCWLWAL